MTTIKFKINVGDHIAGFYNNMINLESFAQQLRDNPPGFKNGKFIGAEVILGEVWITAEVHIEMDEFKSNFSSMSYIVKGESPSFVTPRPISFITDYFPPRPNYSKFTKPGSLWDQIKKLPDVPKDGEASE